jgi:glycosyltransferase involved in cell wall biosynthesis
MLPRWLDMTWANAHAFDQYTMHKLPECDALIALAGTSLRTGKIQQSRGGLFLCDGGSSHVRYQAQIVSDEFRRWRLEPPVTTLRRIVHEETIYERADAIVVPSRFAARSFIEMGVPAGKVYNIPYGVRLETFSRVCDPPQDRFEVLFVGSVGLRKGFPYLLQAFAGLRHPHKRLRVVGPVQKEVSILLKDWPQEHVEFCGSQPQSRLKEFMSGSHVMVLPSIEEGLALVQAQALACGCPVIASTNTGSEDLFSDGKQGFIVPIRDVGVLQQRMQQLADDPQLQQAMSASALELVKELGGWRRYGDRWVSLLNDLCNQAKLDCERYEETRPSCPA